MKIRVIFVSLMLCIMVIFVGTPAAMAEDSKDEIKIRMKKRYPEVKKLKEEKKVGETCLVFVEALNEKYAKDKEVKKIVSAENADRKKLYPIIAKATKTTSEIVGKNNAIRIFNKAGDEEYFKTEEGKWRQKKDMKKKKKE